jgi:hypothetical protein
VKIIIPKHIDFDNPILTSVDVTSFHRDYSEISLADGRRLINACNHRVIQTNGCAEDNQVLCVPNPWRLKANGKVIRHVPIMLYANNTSGNVSKQFNKNISFFSPYLDCRLIYQIRNSIATFYLLQMWRACWNCLRRLLMNSIKFFAQSTLTKFDANKIMYSSDMALEVHRL